MYGIHQSFAAEQEARRKQAFQRAVQVLGSDSAAADWLCEPPSGANRPGWECRLDQAMDSDEGLQAILSELQALETRRAPPAPQPSMPAGPALPADHPPPGRVIPLWPWIQLEPSRPASTTPPARSPSIAVPRSCDLPHPWPFPLRPRGRIPRHSP
jgi:hypothetical protein